MYVVRGREVIAPTIKQAAILKSSFENTTSTRSAERRNQEFSKEIDPNEKKNIILSVLVISGFDMIALQPHGRN